MLYLHWTELIPKEKVPHLFNLFGQEYREFFLLEDENALRENEIKAIQTLKKAPYIQPEQVYDEAIKAWQIAGADESDIQRAQRAWQELQKNPSPDLKDNETPLSREGDVDHLPD